MTATARAGLRLPRLRHGRPWQPSTDAERHLLSEALRLDRQCRNLQADVDRLRAPVDSGAACPLTREQLDALTAAAHGAGLEETGRQLYLSVDGVKAARKRAVAALGARSVTHAVAIAVAARWIGVEQPSRDGGAPC